MNWKDVSNFVDSLSCLFNYTKTDSVFSFIKQNWAIISTMSHFIFMEKRMIYLTWKRKLCHFCEKMTSLGCGFWSDCDDNRLNSWSSWCEFHIMRTQQSSMGFFEFVSNHFGCLKHLICSNVNHHWIYHTKPQNTKHLSTMLTVSQSLWISEQKLNSFL